MDSRNGQADGATPAPPPEFNDGHPAPPPPPEDFAAPPPPPDVSAPPPPPEDVPPAPPPEKKKKVGWGAKRPAATPLSVDDLVQKKREADAASAKVCIRIQLSFYGHYLGHSVVLDWLVIYLLFRYSLSSSPKLSARKLPLKNALKKSTPRSAGLNLNERLQML